MVKRKPIGRDPPAPVKFQKPVGWTRRLSGLPIISVGSVTLDQRFGFGAEDYVARFYKNDSAPRSRPNDRHDRVIELFGLCCRSSTEREPTGLGEWNGESVCGIEKCFRGASDRGTSASSV